MSGEFDSRKDLQTKKIERRPQIFLKLSFRELSNSKLSGLQAFDYMVLYHSSKLVSAILYQTFIFNQMIALQTLCFYFILKALLVLEIFKFLYLGLPLFFYLLAIALETDSGEIINCLNSNLTTHFVSYLEKEIMCDIETFFIDRIK